MKRRILIRLRENIENMEKIFNQYIVELKKLYPRSTIILYGSRARNDYLPYSDYDLLIVLEKVSDKLGEVVRARRVKPRVLPLDLIVIGLDEIRDPLILKALKQGYKILYDALGLSYELEQLLSSIK